MKTAVFLTGHSRGLGRAILDHYLAQDEVEVYGFSRNKLLLSHSNLQEWEVDFTDLAVIETKVAPIFSGVKADRYLLINNAGWIGEIKPVGKLKSPGLQAALHLNLVAPMLLTNSFVNAYREVPGQKIICNLSSGAAYAPVSGWAAYCSSKAGLDMFARVADEDLRPFGFRVFSIAPGKVATEMQAEIREAKAEDFPALERFQGYFHQGELADSKIVASQLAYVLSHPEEFPEVVQDVRRL